MKVIPRTKTPDLVIETVAHDTFDLASRQPRSFTLLVFYRGHH